MDVQTVAFIALSVYSWYFMQKVLKSTPRDCRLTKSEKIQVIITLLLNTIVSWAIYNYGWKKRLPTKSRQVNIYVKNIIIALIVIALVAFFIAIVLIAINPVGQINQQLLKK